MTQVNIILYKKNVKDTFMKKKTGFMKNCCSGAGSATTSVDNFELLCFRNDICVVV